MRPAPELPGRDMAPMPEILPSILAADFARLGEQISSVERGGATILHVDVMDGHFVPNLSLGTPVVAAIRKVTRMKLNVHLMIMDPDRYAPLFIEAGADHVLVHQEVCPHLDRTLRMIRSEGASPGVVINPATPVATLDEVLDLADQVLVMSVNPGFGGQEFLPRSLRKIATLDRLRRQNGLSFRIEIDGGVMSGNTAEIVRAGCDWIVAGSSIFHTPDPGAAYRELKKIAVEASSIRV